MMVNLILPSSFATIAAKRGLSIDMAAQQVFTLGYADWKSRGRKPRTKEMKEKLIALKEKELELRELKLKMRQDSIVKEEIIKKARDEKRLLKAFRSTLKPEMTVCAPEGRKVVLIGPNEPGTAWLGTFEDGSQVMLPINLMTPVPTEST